MVFISLVRLGLACVAGVPFDRARKVEGAWGRLFARDQKERHAG